MKHHQYYPEYCFVKNPTEFNKYTDRELLQYCLGATLYMPGTKDIIGKIVNHELHGITSMVMCFEDAIRESDLPNAEENVLRHLSVLADRIDSKEISHDEIPLIFIRVRNPDQFKCFSERLTPRQACILTGFVFPKFDTLNSRSYLDCLENTKFNSGQVLYGMPILEGRSIAEQETRGGELGSIRGILSSYKESILNIRVGATDFSSIFGVRRGINYSIYDILTVRDILSDILNCFLREGESYIISAPVWEYFLADKRESIDHLLEGDIHHSLLKRNTILNEAIDGLLREVILDKANGFVGKTIIHPSHSKYVNAMQAATQEEYEDAMQILQTEGGVIKSAKSNKMNEINPHRNWARKVYNRALAYGVIENEAAYLSLLFKQS